MAKSKGFTHDQKMEMRASYETPTNLAVIAAAWQVSVPTMATYIRSVGGTIRNPGTPKKNADFVQTTQAVNDLIAKQEPVLVPNPNGITRDMVPNPKAEVNTPQAPVARRILPFE